MGKDKRKPLVELESYNGKVKRFWASGKEAAEYYGISPVLVTVCVKGRAKHAKKKYFRYATPQEMEAYQNVEQRLAETEKEIQPVVQPTVLPVEVIPEVTEKLADDLTPFEKLLKKGKEKLI